MERWQAICMTIISIPALILGIRAWIKMFSTKEILKFPFSDLSASFSMTKTGHYSVFIHGKMFHTFPLNWHPEIVNLDNGNSLTCKRSLFGIQSNDGSRGKVEKYSFRIHELGQYKIEIKSGSSYFLDKMYQGINDNTPFVLPTPDAQLFISIRQSNSLWQKLFLFPQMFLVFGGIMGLIFGLIFSINPNAM